MINALLVLLVIGVAVDFCGRLICVSDQFDELQVNVLADIDFKRWEAEL